MIRAHRRLSVVAAFIVVAAVAAPAVAAPPQRPPIDEDRTSKWPVSGTVAADAGLAADARAAAPADATAAGAELAALAQIELTPCEEDPTFLCGTVPVPLNRRAPDGRVVNLQVAIFPHTGDAPQAEGAVFVTCGGPGCSATLYPKYGFSFFVLPELAETYDLVYIDQRGVGLSDVIDCPELQAGGPLYASSAACHDQLGDTADLYATTDVADDLEDVRLALGYDQIDLFGGSYAGADMMTYAIRHTDHVRSVVLSSPFVAVGTDPWYAAAPEAMPRIVEAVCARSPACAAAHPDPARAFARVARQLRNQPLTGVGVDSAGVSREVNVTENLLATQIMYFNGAHFTGPGEILPAAAAWRRGDPVPLLRLGADVEDPADGISAGDLREYSAGHGLARSCVDGEFVWDKDAPLAQRIAQYVTAYVAEPARYGVISKEAWAAPGWFGFQPSPCIAASWEDRPMYAPGTQVAGVPTLVLGGEYDLPVPEAEARRATEVMVDSTYVGITAAGHDPQFWGDCGPELVQRFYATLDVGDTSCADEPAGGWWVPGSFPTHVAGAPAATQTSGPRVPRSLRRLVTATAWTVMDSVQHNFFVVGDSVALRGGVVDYEQTDGGNQWTLIDAHFTEDLAVDGTITAPFDGPVFEGEITATAADGTSTAMYFSGAFLVDGEDITLTLDIDGQPATFTVPAY